MLTFLFWLSVALIAYHLVGYPILVRLLAAGHRHAPDRVTAPAREQDDLPSLTVIVPARNEEQVIAAKVRNLAQLRYAHDKLTCILALDACTDATEAVARAAITDADRDRIRLVTYERNLGKVALLNDQIAQTQSQLVALSDASAIVAPDALLWAAAHFADRNVGVVTGLYSVAHAGSEGESAYWRYQSDIRRAESTLAGPMGAHGAFYLFRRAAWTALPPDTINDDFVLPMTIVLNGLKAVQEPAITATELERTANGQDYRRRVRIGAGNLQQAMRLWRLADPRRGWTAFTFMSGKGLRGLLPLLMIIAVVTSLLLAASGSSLFALIAVAELLLISIAVWGPRIEPLQRLPMGSTLTYVLQGYLGLTVGAVLVLIGRAGKVWGYSKAFQRAETGG